MKKGSRLAHLAGAAAALSLLAGGCAQSRPTLGPEPVEWTLQYDARSGELCKVDADPSFFQRVFGTYKDCKLEDVEALELSDFSQIAQPIEALVESGTGSDDYAVSVIGGVMQPAEESNGTIIPVTPDGRSHSPSVQPSLPSNPFLLPDVPFSVYFSPYFGDVTGSDLLIYGSADQPVCALTIAAHEAGHAVMLKTRGEAVSSALVKRFGSSVPPGLMSDPDLAKYAFFLYSLDEGEAGLYAEAATASAGTKNSGLEDALVACNAPLMTGGGVNFSTYPELAARAVPKMSANDSFYVHAMTGEMSANEIQMTHPMGGRMIWALVWETPGLRDEFKQVYEGGGDRQKFVRDILGAYGELYDGFLAYDGADPAASEVGLLLNHFMNDGGLQELQQYVKGN